MAQTEFMHEIISVRTEDGHALDGLIVWDPRRKPKRATISMHPDGSGLNHFELEPLARSGFMALLIKSRFAGNNVSMIMEEIMLDITAGPDGHVWFTENNRPAIARLELALPE